MEQIQANTFTEVVKDLEDEIDWTASVVGAIEDVAEFPLVEDDPDQQRLEQYIALSKNVQEIKQYVDMGKIAVAFSDSGGGCCSGSVSGSSISGSLSKKLQTEEVSRKRLQDERQRQVEARKRAAAQKVRRQPQVWSWKELCFILQKPKKPAWW